MAFTSRTDVSVHIDYNKKNIKKNKDWKVPEISGQIRNINLHYNYICSGEASFTSAAPMSVSLTNPFRKDPVNRQRYFRVPFSKPSDKFRYEEYSKSGWW